MSDLPALMFLFMALYVPAKRLVMTLTVLRPFW